MPFQLTIVIVFSLVFILTQNYSLTIGVSLLLAFFIGIFSFLHKKVRKDKINKNISKSLMIIVPILFVLDTLLTYTAVFYKKVAVEANPFVVGLWNMFGIFGGEIARICIFLGLMTLIYFTKKSEKIQKRIVSCYLLLFMYFMWVIIVTSNSIQLFW